MYAVTVAFRLRPGNRSRFMTLMIENARLSRQIEDGCQHFDICCGDDPDALFLYEIYDDKQAFADHLESEHFKAFDAAVADMIDRKEVKLFDEVIR
ncbi:MAG: putative quinol monooxygenase [Pseudomonadota bacterium]